jgi:hypothetical protein
VCVCVCVCVCVYTHTHIYTSFSRWTHWPCGLMHGSTASRLLRLRVWIGPGAWMSIYCESCVVCGRCLCVGLIARPEESHRVWCVLTECIRPASITKRPWSTRCCRALQKKSFSTVCLPAARRSTPTAILLMGSCVWLVTEIRLSGVNRPSHQAATRRQVTLLSLSA